MSIHGIKIDESLKDHFIKLNNSFSLLKTTTDHVSEEALTTAGFLKEELETSLKRFYNVIDSITDMVIIKDSKSRWKTINRYTFKLYNFNEINDFYNKTDKEITKDFPEHTIGLMHCADTDNIAWSTKKEYREIESFFIKGELRHFDIIKTPIFYENGDPKELIIIGRDVTDLKNTEFKNKAFVEALNIASDLIIIIDKDQHILFVNQEFLKIFHLTMLEVGTLKLFSDILLKYDTNGQVSKIKLDVIGPTQVCIHNLFIRINGKILSYLTTIMPVKNCEPDPAYFICRMHLLD